MLDNLWQDLRYGARTLAKSPAFTFVAVLTLALGIGANTAIFSVVNTVLLRPLPYRDAGRLAMIRVSIEGQEFLPSFSPPEILDFQEQTHLFAEVASIRDNTVALTGKGDPEQIQTAWVTPSFLPVMGVEPVSGRNFTPDEAVPNGPAVILLSHGLWQRRFGGDPNIVGKTIQVNGQGVEVVGVLPEGFEFLFAREAGLPPVPGALQLFQFDFRQAPRAFRWMRAVARLQPGVSFEQAEAEMNVLARELLERYPEYEGNAFGLHVEPMLGDLVRDVRPALLALFGAVGFVMLIASANVANLLLARAAAREKEIAVRAALGASRVRLVRQLLTESALLALLGGVGGLLVAQWAIEILVRLVPTNLPRLENVGIDVRVLGFTLGVSLLAVVFCGLAPALHAARADLNESLKESGRASEGAARHRLRSMLVVGEIALSVVLLIGAGLMIRSFVRLQYVDPGFRPDDVLTVNIALPFQRYANPDDIARFFEQLSDRVTAQPGVEAIGGVFPLPMSGRFWTSEYAYDDETDANWGALAADQHGVTPGYLEAIGARLHAGRFFTWQDHAERRDIIIIDDKLARLAWPGQNAVGQRLKVLLPNNQRRWTEVVGVIEHVQKERMGVEGREQIYLPPYLAPFPQLTFAVRSSTEPATLARVIAGEVQALDKDLPIYRVRPLSAYVAEVMASNRFATILMGVFAGVALALALVGLYGVITYAVTQRNHEIGIRVALGAQPRDILRLVLGQGLGLALVGVGLGLLFSAGLTRFLSSLLYEVSATDPITYAGISIALAGVALLACYLPARRATRVDPMIALRYE
jgi:putative ABC transport system permease protein